MSRIEWTDKTWNPIAGCNDKSEGCRNCFARLMAKRLAAMGVAKYQGLTVLQGAHLVWTGKISFDEDALLKPLQRKKPTRYFVNSMSDLFHPNVTDEQIDRIFAVMALCPQHTFQVLTKRPERMLKYLAQVSEERDMQRWTQYADEFAARMKWTDWPEPEYPLLNVWLGVSVENQATADRLDHLCEVAADGWCTMVSFEPLLSFISVGQRWLSLGARTWAIVGGESGPNARPMHPDWARGLRDQCVSAGVPFFFKQWGEWLGAMQDGACLRDKPQALNASDHSVRVGKKAAGDLLDGRQWHQFPEVRA